MSNDPFGGGYQEEANRKAAGEFEIDWDDILDELDWGSMKTVEQLGSVFSSVDWNKVPGGSATLARAELTFPSHPRIDELKELIKEIALDTLGSIVEQQ